MSPKIARPLTKHSSKIVETPQRPGPDKAEINPSAKAKLLTATGGDAGIAGSGWEQKKKRHSVNKETTETSLQKKIKLTEQTIAYFNTIKREKTHRQELKFFRRWWSLERRRSYLYKREPGPRSTWGLSRKGIVPGSVQTSLRGWGWVKCEGGLCWSEGEVADVWCEGVCGC